MQDLSAIKIAVIGLGYVGLPLAVELSAHFDVVGFDISTRRIEELRSGNDSTREIEREELTAATTLTFATDPGAIAHCNFFIVTVPTPIDAYRRPDLTPLLSASRTLGNILKAEDIVVYESTVYPGCTEEECVPILEQVSGLEFNRDFFVGYSPERINPGDKEHRLRDIQKVTAGSTEASADLVDAVYARIITAGTHKAPSIRVAEAAKVIENTQRDVNIALINELAILFNKLGLDTQSVLDAAATKWNFLNFRPGLVGGHCIGVDPYYLTHKAQEIGHHPEIILAGRRINDGMGNYAADLMVRTMLQCNIPVHNAKVLVMGLTFKENCPDLRNTRVIDLIDRLRAYGSTVEVHDPWADAEEAFSEFNLGLITDFTEAAYDGIIVAVPHWQFHAMGVAAIRKLGREDHVLFDMKSIFAKELSDVRL